LNIAVRLLLICFEPKKKKKNCVNRVIKKLTPLKLVCVNAVNNAFNWQL
jgi:hypothetical protein